MKTALVIDFDDTLIKTDSKVRVKKPNGKTIELTPYQYAQYKRQSDDVMDYSDFEKLINPRPITRFVKLLKTAIKNNKVNKITILTARGNADVVVKFLKMINVTSGVTIKALGDSNPLKKSEYVENLIKSGYNRILFIDDAPKNVKAVNSLKSKYPKTNLLTYKVEKSITKDEPSKKKRDISSHLNDKIVNPATGNKILVRTALKYDKSSKAYNTAIKYLKTKG